MRRIVLFALVAAAGTARAQAPATLPPIEPGTRVRIETASDRIEGELVRTLGDTLLVGTRRQRLDVGTDMKFLYQDVRVPHDAVVRLWTSTGREPKGQAALRDGGWGALIGAGFVAASFIGQPSGDGDDSARVQLGVDAAIVSSAAGAIYGWLHPKDRWVEVK